MGHKKESVIKEVDAFLTTDKIGKLYDQGFLNRIGVPSDTNKTYTEVIAGHLLGYIEMLETIPQVTRRGKYRVKRTGTTPRPLEVKKSKVEDRIAMELYNRKTLPPLGEIIHYQTPLKDGRNSAIDLLAYDGENLYIIEFKRSNSEETLLRCVLEAYTYSRMVDCENLRNDFCIPANTPIRKAALVYRDSQAYKDFKGSDIKRLMSALGVDLFILDKSGEKVIEAHYFEKLDE